MKTTQHGDYLIKLTKWGMMNAYFVREDDGFTLVDTLMNAADGIIAAAAQHGGEIKRIVITHAHLDHIGSLEALHAALPDAKVLMSIRTARIASGDLSLDAGEPQNKLRGGFRVIATRPTRQLKEGDRVGALEVIAAPGHTPGQIALMDTRDETLIAGDAIITFGGVHLSHQMNWRFPPPKFATWSAEHSLETGRKLSALAPKRLAVGHGKVVEKPAEAIQAAVAKG